MSVQQFIQQLCEKLGKHRAALLTLCAVVVFCTTYILILPAFTLDNDEAKSQGGISVPETVQETADPSSGNDPGDATPAEAADNKDKGKEDAGKSSEDAGRKSSGKQDTAGSGTQDSSSKTGSGSSIELVGEGEGYTVTATAGKSAGLPSDTRIEAAKIEADDDRYEDYYKQIDEAIREDSGHKEKVAAIELYDISLLSGKDEVQPDAPLDVTISYDKAVKLKKNTSEDNIRIIHFAEDNKGREEAEVIDTDDITPVIEKNKLQETTFKAESFSVYAVVYTVELHKEVLTASGDKYEITVTCGEDAEIPEGAELKVKEILPSDGNYNTLYDESVEYGIKTAEKQGVELPFISGTRIFDIEIKDEGRKIEPVSPVQVNIRLVGNKDKKEHLSVVHFAKDGAETMKSHEVGNAADDSYEVSFEAESFSVYTVQNFSSLADKLDGAKYALVSERGTGITSADGKNSISNFAMTSSTKDGTLAGKGVYKDGNTVGGHVTEWGFESAGNNQYRIYMMDGETKKYIKVSGNNLVLDSNGTAFTASVWNNNKVRFTYNGQSITSTGNNPSTFVLSYNNTGNESLFNLCEVDPNYEETAAKKVSAADWKNESAGDGKWNENDTVVIYRRIMHDDGSENLYVLATDGTLIRADDGGDSIFYHVPEGKNVNWHISLGPDGYRVSNVAAEGSTEPTVYLAPSVTNQVWKSETPVGLTMNGLGSSYGTAIENWDQKTYAYAGLHVDEAEITEGIKPGSGVTSDTFSFAVADTLISDGQLHTVETVDSTSKGLTMKIFNYSGPTYNYGYRNGAMQAIIGDDMLSDWDNRKSHVTKTVETKLGSDGFPVSLTVGSYAPLFTAGSTISYSAHDTTVDWGWGPQTTHDFDAGSITVQGGGANHLFLQSYYDENGMFRYSSMENFARYNSGSGNFTVYRETGTPNIPTENDHYYYYHGHFMPYNDLDPNVSVSRIVDQYGSIADKESGRSFENVYGLTDTPDYYVGMTLEANFVQPKDGTLENGDPVVYRFTGDDDLLVYIDEILVLDVGGIHEPLTGSINFETGEILQPNFYNEGEGWKTHKTTLYEVFKDAHDKGYISDEKWGKMKWKEVNGKPATFADYSTHSFNMFYMERGAGASNLDLAFNLQVIKKNEFIVQKNLPDEIDPRFANQAFKFQASFKDGNQEKPLYKGAKNSKNEVVCTQIVYKDRKDADGNPVDVEVPVDKEGYFYLRAGEAAVFKMADETIEYNVKEVDINSYNLEKGVFCTLGGRSGLQGAKQ